MTLISVSLQRMELNSTKHRPAGDDLDNANGLAAVRVVWTILSALKHLRSTCQYRIAPKRDSFLFNSERERDYYQEIAKQTNLLALKDEENDLVNEQIVTTEK